MVQLFRVFVPTSALALLFTESLILFGCFIAASFIVIREGPDIFLLYDDGLKRIAIVVAGILFGLYFQNLYTHFRVRSRVLLVQQFLLAIGVVFLFQALISYAGSQWVMPRSVMLTGCALVILVLPVWRTLYSKVLYRALGAQKLLFFGANADSVELARRIAHHPELGLSAIGFVDSSHVGEYLSGAPVLAPPADLQAVIAEGKPDRLVVGLSDRRNALPIHHLLELRFLGLRIEEVSTTHEAAFGRISTRDLRPSDLIFSAHFRPRPRMVKLQSLYSRLIAAVWLVAAAPMMLLISIAILLTSRGPVLVRQTRVGLNGVPFQLFKFRSMIWPARPLAPWPPGSQQDPRVTWVGRWIRVTFLDQLPELLNVIRGEMSIVGPRPEHPEFAKTLAAQIPFYAHRYCVKPGITGWAQIRYKYWRTLEDTLRKLEYDLYYIKHLSPSLDLYIMLNTVRALFFPRPGP